MGCEPKQAVASAKVRIRLVGHVVLFEPGRLIPGLGHVPGKQRTLSDAPGQ